MPQTQESRLQPIPERTLGPFSKANGLSGFELYWIPVAAFPPGAGQRAWLLDFFPRLHKKLIADYGVRGEFFLQQKSIVAVEKRFSKLATELLPKLGLMRKPGAPLPPRPTMDQLKGAIHGEAFDIQDHMPDYCYWLRHPDLATLLAEFFGFGGSAMYYMKPDPTAKPPDIPLLDELRKLFPQMQFDKLELVMNAACASKDKFLADSKKLFGVGLEQEPSYAGLQYILPLLSTDDFFTQPEAESKKWFQVFDLFWRESPADHGIYIASKPPLEEPLDHILQSMKEEGKVYPKH